MHQIQTHYPGRVQPLPVYSEPGFLFNEDVQLWQQNSGWFHLLTALNLHTHQLDARCAVFMDEGLAISPKLAPFGSVEFTHTLPDQTLIALLDRLENEVRQLALPVLRLTNYPHCYAPQQAHRLVAELNRRHYRLAEQLTNFHIDVTPEPLAARMHLSERRRLQKCRRAGFTVGVWPRPCVDTVVQFVEQSRAERGYPLTISSDRLAYLLHYFPDQYQVVAARDGDTLAALTVTVRVRQDILYNFLPADNPAYRAFSPTVLLTQGLYDYCRQESISLLDLGVSVDEHHRPKPSLMQFKRNLGAVESPKMCWEKRF